MQTLELSDERATDAFGQRLGSCIEQPCVVFLEGPLGAGKTTLTRGVLRGLGHSGRCKSPTYTIVEPYTLSPFPVFHFDLYRLGDPEELEFIGLRDYLDQESICIFEWPERGLGFMPNPDLEISIQPLDSGRLLELRPASEVGRQVTACLGFA